jgi:hypothetical protein
MLDGFLSALGSFGCKYDLKPPRSSMLSCLQFSTKLFAESSNPSIVGIAIAKIA